MMNFTSLLPGMMILIINYEVHKKAEERATIKILKCETSLDQRYADTL